MQVSLGGIDNARYRSSHFQVYFETVKLIFGVPTHKKACLRITDQLNNEYEQNNSSMLLTYNIYANLPPRVPKLNYIILLEITKSKPK